MRDLAEFFRALSDETRLRILVVLSELGELCACDLESGLEITQSRASRHLATLRHAGLVEDRREGAWVYYGLLEELEPLAAATLEALLEDTAGTRDTKRDVSRVRKRRRSPVPE